MNEFFEFTINIYVLAVICCIGVSIVKGSNFEKYFKTLISAFLLISVVTLISKFNFKSVKSYTFENYSVNYNETWDIVLSQLESELKQKMLQFCYDNGIEMVDLDINLKTDYSSIEIDTITIYGRDCLAAKNLISGYYRIGMDSIVISGE